MNTNHWPTTNLGSCVTFLSGGTPRKNVDSFWSGDIPWVSSGEMTQSRIFNTQYTLSHEGAESGSRVVPKGTSFVVVRGMSLAKEFRVSMAMQEMAFNQDVKAVIPDKSVDPVFLFYYLQSQANPIRDSASEAAHGTKKLDMAVLEQWPLPIVPKPTQLKIAAILSAYDDLIENNKRRIALLEKMAEETFREWFVRFRFPGWQEAKFEKGIPETWKTRRFDKLCKLKRGYDLPDSRVESGPYPVIASTSIKTHHSEFKVKPPVITTGRSGSLGTVILTLDESWPLNTTLYVKDFMGNSPYYIYYTLKNLPLETFNSGAGVPTLNRNHLSGIKLPIPDNGIQERFDNVVTPIFEQAEILKEKNSVLSNMKAQIIPRLISGKLSIEKLEIEFPPSMQGSKTDEAA